MEYKQLGGFECAVQTLENIDCVAGLRAHLAVGAIYGGHLWTLPDKVGPNDYKGVYRLSSKIKDKGFEVDLYTKQ